MLGPVHTEVGESGKVRYLTCNPGEGQASVYLCTSPIGDFIFDGIQVKAPHIRESMTWLSASLQIWMQECPPLSGLPHSQAFTRRKLTPAKWGFQETPTPLPHVGIMNPPLKDRGTPPVPLLLFSVLVFTNPTPGTDYHYWVSNSDQDPCIHDCILLQSKFEAPNFLPFPTLEK